MATITGKDFAFEIDNRDLVRLAMRELRERKQQITVQAVAALSGLSVAEVVATMRQMADSPERSESHGH